MKKKAVRAAVLLVLVCVGIWTLWGNTALEITEYKIAGDRIPKSFSGFRIAKISDLHNAQFGKENSELLALLAEAEPDIIVITGDMIDSRRTDVAVAIAFARQAVMIAPVYYVPGNHEARISEYADLKAGLAEAGVTLLEDQKVRLTREGESITLMGIVDPSHRFGEAESAVRQAIASLQDPADGYTVLLSHRPELFGLYADSGTDLVFSGHAHGGQFRLPLVGGLAAPGQGFFPKYDAGQFTEENTTMTVSRGLGNSIIPIRFNNRPEIVVAELDPA